jgi:chromosome partitioning protein
VLLLDTDPKRPLCAWSSERGVAGIRPRVPARAMFSIGLQPAPENLLLHYNDVLVDAAGRDTRSSRAALAAARLVLVPVQADHVDLATQYKLIGRLNLARAANPALRVLFVVVSGASDPSADALAAIRAYVSRVVSATLASTVLHVPPGCDYGQGRCVCDAETCDPEMAGEMHALYGEVYATNSADAYGAAYS